MKKIMYAFKIEAELIEKVKEKSKQLKMPASAFIRQAIKEKLDRKNRLDRIEVEWRYWRTIY